MTRLQQKYKDELRLESQNDHCSCGRAATHYEKREDDCKGVPFDYNKYFCPFCLMEDFDFSTEEIQDESFLETFNIYQI